MGLSKKEEKCYYHISQELSRVLKGDDQMLRDNMLDRKAEYLKKWWLRVLLKEIATCIILFQPENQNSQFERDFVANQSPWLRLFHW